MNFVEHICEYNHSVEFIISPSRHIPDKKSHEIVTVIQNETCEYFIRVTNKCKFGIPKKMFC